MPRAERERQILDVAHRQFAADGYGGVTMDGVAAAVGVTKPLLYAYWGNKERLYLACLDRDAQGLLGAIDDAVGQASTPPDAFELAIHAFFGFVDEQRSAFRVLFDETLPAGGAINVAVAAYRQRITDMVAASLLAPMTKRQARGARVQVEALSQALLGAAESLARWWLTHPGELTAAQAADLLITTVAPGLRELSQPLLEATTTSPLSNPRKEPA